jgi:hypothetical protein
MSSSYLIIPDREINTTANFTEQLSDFFAQVGGYEENSVVMQLSHILNADLSIFQEYESGELTDETETRWIEISKVEKALAQFILALNANAEALSQVKYSKRKQFGQEASSTLLNESKGDIAALFDSLQEHNDQNPYPPDDGYLSSGNLLKDLDALKLSLMELQKEQVRMIRLIYS